MDEKVYLIDLNCYARADEKQKKNVKESHCFDFGLLPTKGLQKEFRSFIEERSQQCALATMIQERVIYQRFCRMVKDKHIRAESLQELEWEQWLLKIRSWLLEHGQKLTMQGISVYGKEKTVPSSLITYVRKAYRFTEAKEERDEIEKDIWTLENLDIAYKKNPIKNVQTLNFTAIIQDDLREETKKAVYEHLHHEAIATIIKELTAIRRLSKYLKETYPDIHSAEELNRELLEEYLTYLATEAEGVNNYRADLTNLRGLLETIGKLYGYSHLESLFLTSDLPKQVQPKLKSYSDSELIRFNAALAELDEQIERLMVIHQMLGTRISFAIEMLERIKHYFDDERVIFVVSLNKEQLIHTITSYYGSGFDATRYLNKFFDVNINLPVMDRYQKQSIEFSEQRTERKYWLHQLAEELSDYYHLSLRDKLIYKSRIESVPSSTGTYISSESYFISLFVACIILLDIIDIPEKKKFLEGKSTFVASVLPELKAYQRFVNRLIGDGNSTVEESQFQSNCEEVVKVYKYAFETESDEYYERFEISRELKQKCIAASNGHKYY